MKKSLFFKLLVLGLLAEVSLISASAATIRKTDDSVINGDITELQEGKLLIAKPVNASEGSAPDQALNDAIWVPLEDIAIVTIRDKPRPAEPLPPVDTGSENADSSFGGELVKFFLGGGGGANPPRKENAANLASAVPASAATRPAVQYLQGQLILQGKDRWTGRLKAWSQKRIEFEPEVSPNISVEVPVDQIREIWGAAATLVAQARAMNIKPGAEDVAFIEKDGQVHEVRGLVIGIEADSLLFRFNDADRKIGLNRLVGILLAGAQGAQGSKSNRFHQAVELMNGDIISGQIKNLNKGSVVIESAWGKSLTLPLDKVANIQCRFGKLVYLSDLTPARVEQVPYFDRIFPYRNDVTLNGRQLKLSDETYDKGIAVHGRCVLEYDIGGKFEKFATRVGFQQPEGINGQCIIRVLADGKAVYEELNARGDQKPVDIHVSIKGTNRLTLEVDFGQGQDVGDRVLWANARLIRANVEQ
jgi:hypothetical protein